MFKINFVAENNKREVLCVFGAGLNQKFISPTVQVLKCFGHIYIKNKNATISSSVECNSKRLEALLACSVPDLHCNQSIVYHDFLCQNADGKYTKKEGGELKDFLIVVRELKGGPPGCPCAECGGKPVVRVMLNEWADFKAGDPFPPSKCVQALSRSLNTLPGENPDQYIALWYQAGEPVMGRIWNENGKIAANFGWGTHEYKKNVGSIQVLFEMPEHVRGFDYAWKDFKEAAVFGEKEWHPVHVNHHKGDISPGVLIVDGKEILGKVDVRNERASIGYGGAEKVLVGPSVHSCKVLCRKARPGCKFD